MKKFFKSTAIIFIAIVLICIIALFVINKIDKISFSPIIVPSNMAEDEAINYIMVQYFETYRNQGFYRRITDYKIRGMELQKKDGYIIINCGYEVKPFIDDEMEWTLGNGIKLDNGWYFQYREHMFRIIDENTYVLEKVVTMF